MMVMTGGLYLCLTFHDLYRFFLLPFCLSSYNALFIVLWIVGVIITGWYITKYLHIFLQKYIFGHSHRMNWFMISVVIFLVALLGPFIYQDTQSLSESRATTIYVTTLYFIILIALVSSVAMFYYGQEKARKAERELANQQINQQYTDMINQHYLEIRKFKHDYENVLLSIEGYLKADELEGLKAYFYHDLLDEKNQTNDYEQLARLAQIKSPAIRNLFYAKLSYALSQNIPVSVEAKSLVDFNQLNQKVLVRILGIILDNAIEASLEMDEPMIEIVILTQDEFITFLIANNSQITSQQFMKMHQLGYSTKDDSGRGMGLAIVDELVEELGAELFTSVEAGKFIQELTLNLSDNSI